MDDKNRSDEKQFTGQAQNFAHLVSGPFKTKIKVKVPLAVS